MLDNSRCVFYTNTPLALYILTFCTDDVDDDGYDHADDDDDNAYDNAAAADVYNSNAYH